MNLDSWNWENVWECLSQAIFDLSQCMASTLVRLCFRTFARGQHCQELSVLLVASIFPFLSTKRFSCFVTMEVQVFMSRCVLVTKKHLPSREATPSAECSKTPLSQPSNPPGAPAHFDVGTLDISAAGRTSAARKPGVRQQRWQNSPTKWQFPQIFLHVMRSTLQGPPHNWPGAHKEQKPNEQVHQDTPQPIENGH